MASPEHIHQVVTGDHNIVAGTGDINIIYELPPAEAEERRLLLVLLERVRQFWIEGVLEHAAQGLELIDLGKRLRAEAVEQPWAHVLEVPGSQPESVAPDRPIEQLFDDVSRMLLILGGPGSGKTTTLLQLARALLDRAERDPSQPVPVVLNLATWSEQGGDLSAWIVDELKTKYYIPAATGRAWLDEQRLLLLLDGLDEVAPEKRAACVEAIHAFARERGMPGLAVCSRLAAYQELPVRLQVYGALVLQPLRPDQIEAYLAEAGPSLEALRAVLRDDPTLQDLARTPLMLGVMRVAYRDLPADALEQAGLDTVAERQQHLIRTYLDRMLHRKGTAGQPYEPERVRQGLAWLAHQMQRRRQAVFQIEQLQPAWLRTGEERWLYVLLSRLPGALGIGALLWLALRPVLMIDLWIAILMVVLWAGFVGVLDGLLLPRQQAAGPARGRVVGTMLAYAGVGALVGAVLVGPLQVGADYLVFGAITGSLGGALVGLVYGLVFGLRTAGRGWINDIQTHEALRWSWRGALKAGAKGLGWGMLAGILLGLFLFLILLSMGTMGLLAGLPWLLGGPIVGGLIGVLAGVLLGGWARVVLEEPAEPNQGIRLTRQAALKALWTMTIIGGGLGLIAGAMATGLSGQDPVLKLMTGAVAGLVLGGLLGVLIGLVAAALFGGLDVVQHYVLRWALDRYGYFPRRCERFLDYAVQLVVLQRAGGSYLFLHRMFQEYLAAQYEEQASI